MNALTLDTLIAKRACAQQVDLFHQLFGESVTVTPALCVEHAAQFDWEWDESDSADTDKPVELEVA